MKKVRLTKLENLMGELHPNNINEGYVKEGYLVDEPKVGISVFLSDSIQDITFVVFHTSVVTEILDNNKFRTLNSIYHYEYI